MFYKLLEGSRMFKKVQESSRRLCEYKSISVEYIEVHKKSKHAQVPKFRCDRCEYES